MRVIWTSWAHVWRLRSLFLGMGCDINANDKLLENISAKMDIFMVAT
jgi:hypothetical protein